jgi:hypothetical protein
MSRFSVSHREISDTALCLLPRISQQRNSRFQSEAFRIYLLKVLEELELTPSRYELCDELRPPVDVGKIVTSRATSQLLAEQRKLQSFRYS